MEQSVRIGIASEFDRGAPPARCRARHSCRFADSVQRYSACLGGPVRVSSRATTVTVMAKQRMPTPEDRTTAIRVTLSGIAEDLALRELAERLAPLHPKNDTFPGEVLLELAADAIEEAGATRKQPLEFEGIRKRHLPEDRAHTEAQHHKAEYALRAAAIRDAAVEAIPLSTAHSDVRAQIVRRAAHRTHTEPVRNPRRTRVLRSGTAHNGPRPITHRIGLVA
jgi:hypothetical protein